MRSWPYRAAATMPGERKMSFLDFARSSSGVACNRLRAVLCMKMHITKLSHPSYNSLTCDVRTWKEISEVQVIMPLNLKEVLPGANLQNSPVWPNAQVLS